MIPFVETAPDGSDSVRGGQVEELREVEDVEELGTVTNIEPHPVTVGLQAHRLEAEELEEARLATSPPVHVRLILVKEARRVALRVVVVAIGATTTALIAAHTFFNL